VALGAAPDLADYIERAQAAHFVPTRGGVDVLIGGPPCQGVRELCCTSRGCATPVFGHVRGSGVNAVGNADGKERGQWTCSIGTSRAHALSLAPLFSCL